MLVIPVQADRNAGIIKLSQRCSRAATGRPGTARGTGRCQRVGIFDGARRGGSRHGIENNLNSRCILGGNETLSASNQFIDSHTVDFVIV